MSKVRIIYKRKYIDRGSEKRGGTWKVAYADFITAMMAFFMMLWLLSITPQNKLQGIAQYFTVVNSHGDAAGLGDNGGIDHEIEKKLTNKASSSLVYGSPARGRRINNANDDSGLLSDIEQKHFLSIMNNIQKNVEIKEYSDNINIDVTPEGLRIQVMDSDNRPVFKPNTYELQPYMVKVLNVISRMIKEQPNYLALTGHTASIKDVNMQNKELDHWFLSAMRANEIRKFLVTHSVDSDKIASISGKADTEPFDPKNKYNNKNIRVSITLLNDDVVSKYQKAQPADIIKNNINKK